MDKGKIELISDINKLSKGDFLLGANINFNELFKEQIDLDYYRPFKEKYIIFYLGKITYCFGYKKYTD